jgi:hypothetical protein
MSSSPSHQILLGLFQLLSGVAGIAAWVVTALLVLIVLYSLIRGNGPRLAERVRWFRFITCAFLLAVIAGGIALIIDSSPMERVGAPGVWLILALLFGFLWLWASRQRQDAPSS